MTVKELLERAEGWAPETEVLVCLGDQTLEAVNVMYSLGLHLAFSPSAPSPALLILAAKPPS